MLTLTMSEIMMSAMSRPKNSRVDKQKHRADHPVQPRFSSQEMANIHADIDAITRAAGFRPTPTSYVKHAALSYMGLRRLKEDVRELISLMGQPLTAEVAAAITKLQENLR